MGWVRTLSALWQLAWPEWPESVWLQSRSNPAGETVTLLPVFSPSRGWSCQLWCPLTSAVCYLTLLYSCPSCLSRKSLSFHKPWLLPGCAADLPQFEKQNVFWLHLKEVFGWVPGQGLGHIFSGSLIKVEYINWLSPNSRVFLPWLLILSLHHNALITASYFSKMWDLCENSEENYVNKRPSIYLFRKYSVLLILNQNI